MGWLRRGALVLVVAAAAAPVTGGAAADEVAGVVVPAGRGDGPGQVRPAVIAAKTADRRVARRAHLVPLDVAPLRAEDLRDDSPSAAPRARRTGVVRRLGTVRAPRRLRAGMKDVVALPDGGLAWTFEAEAPGAVGLRLHVAQCALPPGAQLVVYDADEPAEAFGPFESAGPRGTGEFWAPTVYGERVRLELRVPPEQAGASVVLAVDRVVQHYRTPRPEASDAHAGVPPKVGTCYTGVACDPQFGGYVAKGVSYFEFVEGGVAGYSCTGSLLNDNDPTTSVPYFLTAHHCVSDEATANSVDCYWDYYATTCGGVAPSPSTLQRTHGATLLVSSAATDVTLLRLTGSVPAGRTFLGWTSTRPTEGSAVATAHHPDATEMRVSKGNLTFVSGLYPTGLQLTHHEVVFTSGSTEPGSSGAPLLNASLQVIGQLYGGWNSCADMTSPAWYGSFDVSYPLLKPHIWDKTGSTPPPPGGGSVGGGGGTTPPGFFLGLWQSAKLGDAAFTTWQMDILYPRYTPRATPRLKVQVKGRKGTWVRISDPAGHVTVHPRGKSFVGGIVSGYWPLELHAAEKAPVRRLQVRVTKNW